MNAYEALLRSGLIAKITETSKEESGLISKFQLAMADHGFLVDENIATALSTSEILHYIHAAGTIMGTDYSMTPMYHRYTETVAGASEFELVFNAIIHYLSDGTMFPDEGTPVRTNNTALEAGKMRKLETVTHLDIEEHVQGIISSPQSLSVTDKKIAHALIVMFGDRHNLKNDSSFKENAIFFGTVLERPLGDFLSTPTDVMRYVNTVASRGCESFYEASTLQTVNIKSLSRSIRKQLVSVLNDNPSHDDVARRIPQFKALFRLLHVGEFKQFPHARKLADDLYNGRLKTFNQRIETIIGDGQVMAAINVLSERPSEFARRILHLLRLSKKDHYLQKEVVRRFDEVVDQVPLRVLYQLCHAMFQISLSGQPATKIIFPKGNMKGMLEIENKTRLEDVGKVTHQLLEISIRAINIHMTDKAPHLNGKSVHIDPNLETFPVPMGARDDSSSLLKAQFGTHIPLDMSKENFRFFIHWIGHDVDLSVVFYDNDLTTTGHVSYTQLRNAYATHSGDIVRAPAPDGAAEFIDVNIQAAKDRGVRYIGANVMSYSREKFSEMETASFGWMELDDVHKNAVFQPHLVTNRVQLTAPHTSALPCMVDLHEGKLIWIDAPYNGSRFGLNNVEDNTSNIVKIVHRALDEPEFTLTMNTLLEMLVARNGAKLVDTPEEADVVYTTDDVLRDGQTFINMIL